MTSSSPVGFLSDLSATEAFENLKSNRHARWPDRHEPTNRVEPMCAPHFAAPFPITPGASVFTIGSCFARNVEKGLIKLGFDVPARRAVGAGVDANVLNTFTANSMLNEVTWPWIKTRRLILRSTFMTWVVTRWRTCIWASAGPIRLHVKRPCSGARTSHRLMQIWPNAEC